SWSACSASSKNGQIQRPPRSAERPELPGDPSLRVRMLVNRVDPIHRFRLLDGRDVEVDDNRFIVTAHQYALQMFGRARVDLLVWNVRRDVDEIAGFRLGHEL